MTADLIGAVIGALPESEGRVVIGIAGAPGAGKTTLADEVTEELIRRYGEGAAVSVPMDGFHLANVELRRLGRADRKGAPDTFDALGYVALLERLRRDVDDTVYAPAFDHVLNEGVAGSIPIHPGTRFIVTEGNYLLVPTAPWDRVRSLLDVAAFLEADDAQRLPGLLARQRSKGLSEEAAREWVFRSDEANARLIATTRDRAGLILRR
ncbi:pantothenate kinase [Allocatelliglobosispora scoriae]|uniref:Pantothenate kinase n=1 Tax=Allocatelliglobosispora scoriae TaxID=643052 RepID=A0A841BLL0_9ACTN|nr:nucleoside/nucleotide kinase family protein [Allocatelliglobosispora scoriae]MBB5869174.1 pantothenate kinase [Allocatelliglobosispora scoriae]